MLTSLDFVLASIRDTYILASLDLALDYTYRQKKRASIDALYILNSFYTVAISGLVSIKGAQ